jgi:hypothetical protein
MGLPMIPPPPRQNAPQPPAPPDDPPGYMEMMTGWGSDIRFHWPQLTYKRWSAIWSGVGLALAIKQLIGG